jgi:hypothetical protein
MFTVNDFSVISFNLFKSDNQFFLQETYDSVDRMPIACLPTGLGMSEFVYSELRVRILPIINANDNCLFFSL